MTRLYNRTLAAHPNLEQLKRQAKELLHAFTSGDADAVAEVRAHYHDANPGTFALHDAQLVIARAYGFESWPKLKAFVDGATVRRLFDAVRAGKIDDVRELLSVRPELARMSIDNMQAVHHAVLARAPEMVRLLMQHGANARDGVYPYRDATTAHAIAVQRGYDEIVRIIEEVEQDSPAHPSRMTAAPLHAAAHALNAPLVKQVLDGGADPRARAERDLTPLDAAARRWYHTDTAAFEQVAALLIDAGAPMTPSAAAALGDTAWLRAKHEEGAVEDLNDGSGGLLRIAVTHNRPDILELLLDFGFDPDERVRLNENDDGPFTWGMALQHAVQLDRYAMAETLLTRGADPNASIYASGNPLFSAYSEGNRRMIALLERHGAVTEAATPGLFRQRELARRMLDGEAPYRVDTDQDETLAEKLLWGAACGGDPEIVRMALDRVNWSRDDPRWFTMLESTLRKWAFGSATEGWDESTYLICFRMLLERCDPNLRGRPTDGGQFGLTTLHNIVARGDMSAEERVTFAAAILDRGARLDMRDNLLESTPLGWACRWGQLPLVKLFLSRGADPVEADAEPWATPRAWAQRMKHEEVLELLGDWRPGSPYDSTSPEPRAPSPESRVPSPRR